MCLSREMNMCRLKSDGKQNKPFVGATVAVVVRRIQPRYRLRHVLGSCEVSHATFLEEKSLEK